MISEDLANARALNSTNLAEDHGGDFLRRESLGLAEVLNLHLRVAALVDDLERPRLNVLLDGRVVVSPSDQTLDIEDGVGRVHGSLVLGGLTDETLLGGEGNEGRGGEGTLVVGDCNASVRIAAAVERLCANALLISTPAPS